MGRLSIYMTTAEIWFWLAETMTNAKLINELGKCWKSYWKTSTRWKYQFICVCILTVCAYSIKMPIRLAWDVRHFICSKSGRHFLESNNSLKRVPIVKLVSLFCLNYCHNSCWSFFIGPMFARHSGSTCYSVHFPYQSFPSSKRSIIWHAL